jgi:hypothetical protein
MTIVSCCMQHGRHNDGIVCFDYFVDHSIGESVGVTPADVLPRMSATLQHWVRRQFIKHPDDLLAELGAQAGLLRVISLGRLTYVGLDFWTKQHPPFHGLYWRRSRCFISSRDIDESGLARWSARRDSTRASSMAGSPLSSSSTARRISNWRCSNVSDGNSSSTSAKLMDP